MSEFLTIPELAKLLRLSPPAARAAVRRGEVPGARRIGRKWLVRTATFEASFAAPVTTPRTTNLLDPARLLRPIPKRIPRNP